MKSNLEKKQIVADRLLERLKIRYPNVERLLNSQSPWQLLVATVLSAQCTDARVNIVTPDLFALCPDPASLLAIGQDKLEELIKSTGFYKNKAKNLLLSAEIVLNKHNNQVPKTMEELVLLPGLGRKTANVVLFGAYNLNFGIAVDTHVARISNKLALSQNKDPVKIEQDLMKLFPQSEWGGINNRLVRFGRDLCKARKALCVSCEMNDICPRLCF